MVCDQFTIFSQICLKILEKLTDLKLYINPLRFNPSKTKRPPGVRRRQNWDDFYLPQKFKQG